MKFYEGSKVAHLYAGRPMYPARLFELLGRLVPSRRLALDCGCGTGQASWGLGGVYSRVIGIDSSRTQVRAARKKYRRRNIAYLVREAERTGLPDQCADLVVAMQAAHWFGHSFWAEAARVLKPGGILAVGCYGRPRLECGRLQSRMDRLWEAGEHPPQVRLAEQGYRDLPLPCEPAFQEETSQGLQMQAAWAAHQVTVYVRTWNWVGGVERRSRAERRIESLIRALRTAWGEGRHVLHWDLIVHLRRRADK